MLFFILILCIVTINGQENLNDIPRIVTEKSGCEITERELDVALNQFKKNTLKGTYLVIIGRTAKGEKQFYNSKRISTVMKYFLKRGIEKQKVVYAKAEAINNFGYVEIYINGQLWLVMKSNPKKDFCTYCCEEPNIKVLFRSIQNVRRS